VRTEFKKASTAQWDESLKWLETIAAKLAQ
jgi:hypothetical protein